MRLAKVGLGAVIGVALAGCGAATADQLQTRAAFDLQCDADKLQVVELDDQTRGVRGCGKQVTYVERCNGPATSITTECTWVLNTDSTPVQQRNAGGGGS